MTDDALHSVREHLCLVFSSDADLGMCGCNDPDAAWRLIHYLLTEFATEGIDFKGIEAAIGTPGAVHIVLSTLERAGLTEHGSSLWGSWLTTKGKWVLWAINAVGVDDLDSKIGLEAGVGYPHDGEDVCTDECWKVVDSDG